MNLTDTQQVIALAIGALTLLGLVAGLIHKIRPKWRAARARFTAAVDSIAGRPAVTDSITGRVYAPELPSIGKRMESVEGSVSRLVEVIRDQHEQNQRLDAHDLHIAKHDSRISTLEEQALERIVGKVDSAAAWGAMQAIAEHADPTAPKIEEKP